MPDFIIKFQSGEHLVLEIKGQKSPQNDAKHAALEEWIAAVNEDGQFGKWSWGVAYSPTEVDDVLAASGSETHELRLELGRLSLLFDGNFGDTNTGRTVANYINLLNDRLRSGQAHQSLKTTERKILQPEFSIELVEIVQGSIIANAKVVGKYLVTAYGLIAAYPSFKEAVPIILQEVEFAIEHIAESLPEGNEDIPKPIKVDFFARDEESIGKQIRDAQAKHEKLKSLPKD